MKKIVVMALAILMLMMTATAFAETVTAYSGNGMSNTPFSDGYYAFCLDFNRDGAEPGQVFTMAENTTAARNNKDNSDISQKLKVLFTQCFEELFSMNENTGEYYIDNNIANGALHSVIYMYTGDYGWHSGGLAVTLHNKVTGYTGDPIPDDNYQLVLDNGDVITFHFRVFIPENENVTQVFFAYKFDVQKAGSEPETYNVTVIEDEHGTVEANPTSGPTDTEVTLTAKADDGYEFAGWQITPDTIEITENNTFKLVDSDVEVKGIFVEKTYTVEVTTDGNGTASADKEEGPTGTEVTLTATPKEGFEFDGWTVESGNVKITDNKFTIGESDVVVKATFKEIPKVYNVTVTTEGNGTASADPVSGVEGTEVTLNATPAEDSEFVGWTVESGGVEIKDGKFTIGKSDVEVKATFKDKIYNVTVSDDGHGTGTATPDSGKKGDEVELKATPADGYQFKEWILVSGEKASLEEDTLTIGSSDVEVKATFELIPPTIYNVTVRDDGNGTGAATPNEGTTGTEVTLTATPKEGYQFKEWQVISGGVTVENNQFTIGESNVEVKAIFEEIPPTIYNVTVSNDGNGTGAATPNEGETGTTVTLTATPADGYQFKEWEVITGDVTVEDNQFTIGKSNVEVKATFELIPPTIYNVTVRDDGNGTGAATPNEGETGTTVTLTAKPNEGYQFKEWQVVSGGVTVENNQFTIGESNVEVKAIFEEIPLPPTPESTPEPTATPAPELTPEPEFPDTGDSSAPVLWLVMSVLSLLGILLMKKRAYK